MAIHHLTGEQKKELFREMHGILVGRGVFVIADIVEHVSHAGDRNAAEAWDRMVLERAIELDGSTEAFEVFRKSGWNTFWFLDPEDIDKLSTLYD